MKQNKNDFNPEGSEARSWHDAVTDFLKGETIKEARVADGCVILFFESGRSASFEGQVEEKHCNACGETRHRPIVDKVIAAPPASVLD